MPSTSSKPNLDPLAFSLIVLSFLHHVAPVPMEDIERMAALCMKDLDEDGDDDGDLENDSDLLVRQKHSCLYITTGGTSDAIFLSGKGFD